MRYHSLGKLAVVASAWAVLMPGVSCALMGSETIIARVDKDGDKKLSLEEVRAAAARQYDLIKSKNGDRVTMLQLGGRLVPADLKAVAGTPGVAGLIERHKRVLGRIVIHKWLLGADWTEVDRRRRGNIGFNRSARRTMREGVRYAVPAEERRSVVDVHMKVRLFR